MDIRDFNFWYSQANIRLLEDEKMQCRCINVGQASVNDFNRHMEQLRKDILKYEIGKEAVHRMEWESMKGTKK